MGRVVAEGASGQERGCCPPDNPPDNRVLAADRRGRICPCCSPSCSSRGPWDRAGSWQRRQPGLLHHRCPHLHCFFPWSLSAVSPAAAGPWWVHRAAAAGGREGVGRGKDCQWGGFVLESPLLDTPLGGSEKGTMNGAILPLSHTSLQSFRLHVISWKLVQRMG